MPAPADYTSIDIKPLSGPMDTRSLADAVAVGSWRYRQNVMVVDQGKPCRRPGWQKYRGERAVYNNEDLHDQLTQYQYYYEDRDTPYSPQSDITVYPPGNDADGQAYCKGTRKVRTAGRQPVTFLFDSTSTTGVRKLLSGTQNRIYELDEGKGNWQIIADAYGGEASDGLHRRWYAAQVKDVIVFTNNYDPVVARVLDSPIQGCGMQGVQTIESLDGIGLAKASVICSWKDTIFLADVEMDGDRIESRVVWSRYRLPLDFNPGTIGSNGTAGKADLTGGRILAMVPLGDVLVIYTTHSIWHCEFVGGEQVFTFTQRYAEEDNGEACLAYRNTIISTGKEHLYCGRDGIYTYSLFLPRPDRLEWMHKATSQIFSTIDETACDRHVGWFYPATKEYWISWVEKGNELPARTLVLNTMYETSDFVDHGFSAFCNHAPDDRGTLLDFLISRGLCTAAELEQNSDTITIDVKEGGFCDDSNASENPENLPDRNLPIYTTSPLDVDGKAVEDYTKLSPDANSLCALLGDLTIEDLCQECPKAGLMVMASAVDFALKQYSADSGTYFRESVTDISACGAWTRDGYDSIMRSGAQDYGFPGENKDTRALELEYEAGGLQIIPSALQMRIGYSAQAIDSNIDGNGRCALVWRDLKPKTIECLSVRAGSEHVKAGTRPAKTMRWDFFYTGRYFYYELKISGVNGAVCLSRLSGEIKQSKRSVTS